jgi:KaiC/GvpD/RAD55 family RecA-like ATPase
MSDSNTQPKEQSAHLAAALDYARQGIMVFPLEPRGKKPLGRLAPNGVKNATVEEATIRRWWTDTPDANIGIATGRASGVTVVDVDGEEGEKALANILHGAEPLTRQAKTGKGRHLFFSYIEGVKNSAGTLGAKLDIRNDGGYVVAAPSIHPSGHAYTWLHDSAPIAEVPDTLRVALRGEPEKEDASTGTWLDDLRREGIPEGKRNETLAKVAGFYARRLIPAGVRVDVVHALVMQFNRDACSPPLDDAEVRAIVNSITAKEQEKGTGSTRPGTKLLTRAQVAELPPVEWLIDGVLPVDALSVLYGEPGAAKTFLALDIGAAIAAGNGWCGRDVRQGAVVYVCAESPRGLAMRLAAWESVNNDGEPLQPFFVYPDAVQLLEAGHVAHLIEQIRAAGVEPRLIVFDTLARCTVGADENSVEAMGKAIAMADRVRKEFGATVLLVHHSRKGDARVIRGSSVVAGAVDTSLSLVKDEETGERVLSMTKQKDAEEMRSLRFRLQPVPDQSSVSLTLVGESDNKPTLSKTELDILAALEDAGSLNFIDWLQLSGDSRTTFNRVIKRLQALTLVVKEGKTYRPTKPREDPHPSF